MTETYRPLIEAPADDGGFAVVNVITLQDQIDAAEVTHVRTRRGEVWKIHRHLNKKSVPLNDSSAPPTRSRVNFTSVESFGVLVNPEVIFF
mgnify:CR=1 FL=1